VTLKLIEEGKLDFTFDEQPYLQGFLAVLQLFFARVSGGLVGPADTRITGRMITRGTVRRFLARTRFEGSSSKHRYPLT
jgi:simple sugar transport system substrate-binding protein